MKQVKKITKIALFSLFGLLLTTCQKENTLIVNQLTSNSALKSDNVSPQLKSTSLPPDYLEDLVVEIHSLVAEGILNAGQGNSLMVKIDNYLKKTNSGGSSVSSSKVGGTATGGSNVDHTNLLNALMNQMKSLIETGVLTEEQGQPLINLVDYEILKINGSFIDPRDGQEYSVVLIGDQWWMAENLKATIYNDGTAIPNVTSGSDWAGLATGAYCWYNNDISNKSSYGALYNWYAVNTQKLAPIGWHVPSESEWNILINYLGGYDVAANELKETGSTHWRSPNTGATNSSLFTALPGGWRNGYNGSFGVIGTLCNLWSSSEDVSGSPVAWNLWFYVNSSDVLNGLGRKKDGYSVRCIHD